MDPVGADAGTVALVSPKGRKITWSPGRWGGDQAEAFDEVANELRQGDRVQFTRNNRRTGRNNGDIATVRAIDPQGTSVLVEKDDGSQQMLDLSRARDGVALYTDSRARLTEALGLRDGAQVGAIDEILRRELVSGQALTP